MKILPFILSLYILVLTAIPCIDEPNDISLNKITHSISGNQQTDIDHCSPFCTCDCCVSPIIYKSYMIQFNSYSLYQKQYSTYSSNYNLVHYASIWQPPQII